MCKEKQNKSQALLMCKEKNKKNQALPMCKEKNKQALALLTCIEKMWPPQTHRKKSKILKIGPEGHLVGSFGGGPGPPGWCTMWLWASDGIYIYIYNKSKYKFAGPMAHWREGSSALVVVLIAYRHDYEGLPGSLWPQMLSGQCVSSDLWNHPKVMVSYGFHH